ncbi:hypothetical protein NMY22_g18728 [Coprinellus aureogranulatus]|nr:hypothetical protein NMY22_g18728 [Coprinellus aureogranulatus]
MSRYPGNEKQSPVRELQYRYWWMHTTTEAVAFEPHPFHTTVTAVPPPVEPTIAAILILLTSSDVPNSSHRQDRGLEVVAKHDHTQSPRERFAVDIAHDDKTPSTPPLQNLHLGISAIALPTQKTDKPSMIISKQNRRIIYENLFKEGVLVAKKDFNAPKHEELDVPNLEVIKAMQSLTSKNLVKTQFSWQWYYYVLTPEGVEYLREWLHLPAGPIVVLTLRRQHHPRPRRSRRELVPERA